MGDSTDTAGATPVAGGATPPQSPPAPPAPVTPPAAPPLATDGADALGDAGKRALDEERKARKAAEDAAKALQRQLDDLQAANQSDADKALAEAKKAGAIEVFDRVSARIRSSEVRARLTAAGINPSVLDLAAKADEFAALKVTEDLDVEGIDEAIDAFKKARGDLFKPASATPPAPTGSADGGSRGPSAPAPAASLEDAINRRLSAATK